MSGGFPNKPKILRGAFVEFGLSLPPLIVPFQFNPVDLKRNRSLTFSGTGAPATPAGSAKAGETTVAGPSLRQFHQQDKFSNLLDLRRAQKVTVQEETIQFDMRLDATEKLEEGDPLATQFGIMPQLSSLELMLYPKSESLFAADLGFRFTRGENPPMILFIWGRKRVLPVNINSMNITETEFSTDLNPIRATLSVSLTVIEGPNPVFTYSKAMKEVMSGLNLANIANITDVVIPG
ncbi:hypothetical protein [Desulfoluna spongiiphila]|uniref:Uncharacterized protein n=1 Tax=Desulfoluna spongiiphila TaxID=419481 RepID=A0A1G5J1T9_9BACT|nr:hypothetical protein [Desulfoluna spongiiphila]SCY82326.1 hypothetical protein SAMN05216233_12420 [Desulfoluna spongiiphila]